MRGRRLVTVLAALCILAAMGTLTTYSVTLYRLFCQATGAGGTTQTATGPAGPVLDRTITVRFNADIDPKLPWRFEPAQGPITVRVGEPSLAYFRAKSLTNVPITGQAVYNVTPDKAGLYFDKVACFCFTQQTLQPGQTVDMPVQFFIDPAIVKNRNLDDLTTVTLSYTFYKVPAANRAKPVRSARTETVSPTPEKPIAD